MAIPFQIASKYFGNYATVIREILSSSSILPILGSSDRTDADRVLSALIEAGLKTIEVTLRHNSSLDLLTYLIDKYPELCFGAGTVTSVELLTKVKQSGAGFAISPGISKSMLKAAKDINIPYLPGVATASEIMQGMEYGYDCFKLFPAEAIGGIGLLKGLSGPFKGIKFCPTGGINSSNFESYLNLDNVMAVGGTWVISDELSDDKLRSMLTGLAKSSPSEVKNGPIRDGRLNHVLPPV